jgi:RNA polymerase sigma-70 factor (ECF subfamily)
MTHAFASHPDAELIARVRAGDERAYEELFRRYYRELCLYAARIDPSDGAAEEIVQDVFFKVWQRRERLMEVKTLSSYLYMAVRNGALNRIERDGYMSRWRRAKHVELESSPAFAPSADAEARSAEVSAAIEAALAKLPPRCREAFLLQRRQHLSVAEIARIMGIAPKTVEVQIGNALRQMRESLREWLKPD